MSEPMDPQRWNELQRLYHLTRGLAEEEQRALLEHECADRELLEELLSLLEQERQLAEGSSDAVEREAFEGKGGDSGQSLLGTVLGGKIRIESILGQGGMGIVFGARHLGLRRRVAVKFLAVNVLGSASAHERFDRECRALGRLRHESVVSILDHGRLLGRPYLVMDWIEGCDLHQWLEHACALPAPPRAAREVESFLRSRLEKVGENVLWTRSYWEFVAVTLAQVARALAAAHEHAIIHRDVKPSNIQLAASGRPCLTDFGLVAMHGEETAASASGPLGTLAYMPPEQLRRGQDALDPRADVYGLGATLYHLITLVPPFRGSAAEVLAQLSVAVPKPPRLHAPDVPRDLEAICLKALEKRPADRYPSATACAEDLEAFVQRRPVSARHPSTLGRMARWCQRRPGWAAAIALAMLLVPSAGGASVLAGERRLASRQREVQAELLSLDARLPALLTLEHKPDRPGPPYREPEYVGELLNRMLELAPQDAVLLFYRASFRSQHDDPRGAAEDLEAIARQNAEYDTPLLASLSSVLTDAEESGRWNLPKPDALPETRSDLDAFMRGHVALRWQFFEDAYDHLTRALGERPEQWRYRDLRLIAAIATDRLDVAEDDAGLIERALGTETARTCHVAGFVSLQSGRLESAEGRYQRSLALCPDQFAVLNNLGLAYTRLDRLEEAVEVLERACELRPEAWRSRVQVAALLRDQDRFQEAEDFLMAGMELVDATERHELMKERARILLWRGRRLQLEGVPDADNPYFAACRAEVNALTVAGVSIRETAVFLEYFTGNLALEGALEDLWGTIAHLERSGRELGDLTAYVAQLGWLLSEAGRSMEAEVILRAALSDLRCPSFVAHEVWLLEAEQQLVSGNVDAALEILRAHPSARQGLSAGRAAALLSAALAQLGDEKRRKWEEKLQLAAAADVIDGTTKERKRK